MLITTWKKIDYDFDDGPNYLEMEIKEPDSGYWNLGENTKWKLASSCFDTERKIIYYSWELVEK